MPKRTKTPALPTPSEYAGQTARLCAHLGIEPAPDAWGGNRETARFEAVADWLQEAAKKKIENK